MNEFHIYGRLTKDAELKTAASGNELAHFTLAVDRQPKDAGTDFIQVVAFGKTAANLGKYTSKGQPLIVTGHIQTGDYEKDGKKVYSTSLIADRVEFVGSSKKEGGSAKSSGLADMSGVDAKSSPAASDEEVW